jgi:hypothetical protein
MFTETLEMIKAVGTPAAAAAGVYIAYKFGRIQAGIAKQQADTAARSTFLVQNKLKMEMFDRRMVVYKTIADMLTNLATKGWLSNEDETAYLVGTNGAHWLFNDEIVELVERSLWRDLLDYRAAQTALAEIDETSAPGERERAANNKHEARKALLDQRADIDDLFAHYMRIQT